MPKSKDSSHNANVFVLYETASLLVLIFMQFGLFEARAV